MSDLLDRIAALPEKKRASLTRPLDGEDRCASEPGRGTGAQARTAFKCAALAGLEVGPILVTPLFTNVKEKDHGDNPLIPAAS